MAATPIANGDRRLVRGASVLTYARVAGVLLLISLVAGGFGEFFVPSQLIVTADATATANNIVASDQLFRLGFVGYLVEAMCDVALSLFLYVLLRPVQRDLALLAVFFRLVATATFAAAEPFYLAAPLILGDADYLKTFSPDQLNSLALLSVRLSGYAGGVFSLFYGVASVVLGYLMFRSGYLPRFLGALFALSGLAFVIRSFALILAPALPSSALLLLVAPAGLALTAWLVVRGVDVPRWEKMAMRSP